MEEIESTRTIEGLRGRLLAERSATKQARHEAELMENKLAELEEKLRQETKCKHKADKKLRFLLDKLQSSNLNYVLHETEDGGSAVSLLVAEDANKQEVLLDSNPEGSNKANVAQSVTGSWSGSSNSSEDTLSTLSINSEFQGKDGSAENCIDLKSEQSFDEAECIEQRIDGSKSSTNDELVLKNELKVEDTSNDQDVDNSLPLVSVPPGLETSSSDCNDRVLKKGSFGGAVSDALDALRHARGEIQSSIERRNMIKLGWPQLVPS